MRIVCIGEAMVELSRGDGGLWRMGYGGDTLNTAIHLARLGHDVAYMTALGADPISAQLRRDWEAEGLDTSLVMTHPTRHAGLYAIDTDAAGERSFTYWRSESAAREMFKLADDAATRQRAVAGCDLLYHSLITGAILPDNGWVALMLLTSAVREGGGRVAVDGNYRPRLWPDARSARLIRDAALRTASIGLPTLEDERLLSGAETGDAVAAQWRDQGCEEVVVKLGPDGCRLPDGTVIAPDAVLDPVDTSGAGDAFNAGYLDARLRGATPDEAAGAGHALAGWTIMRRGAIPARDS